MRKYAIEQTVARLARFAFQVQDALRSQKAEDVHDLRVSIRRFQECLRTFEEHFEPQVARKCRRRLRRIMALAAEVRNRDIAMELLEMVGVGQRSPLVAWLGAARNEAMRALAEDLRRLKQRSFSRRWRLALGAHGAESKEGSASGMERAAAYAARQMPKLARKFFKRGRRAANRSAAPEALHQFRLAAKRLRYALELFQPVYGPGLAVRLGALQQLQRRLGEVNDCVTVCELLQHAPPEAARAARVAVRRLSALGEQRTRNFRLYWKRSFDAPEIERRWIAYLSRFAGRTGGRHRS